MSGKKANKTGNRLEKWIMDLLKDNHYIEIPNNRYLASKDCLAQKIYSKQFFVGTTIYGGKRKCDLITYNPHIKTELIIECKWQESKGSVDEKYPYLVLNIHESKINTIIILDGGGYKFEAEKWLKEQVGGVLIGVMSMTEFSIYIKNKNIF